MPRSSPSKKPIVLSAAEDLEAVLANLAVATQKPGCYEVVIRPVREKVSPSQRGIYRIWLRQIANHIGEHQDKVHQDLASTFLSLPHSGPDGTEVMGAESTGDLERAVMSDYLEWIRYFACTELGLSLEEQPMIPKAASSSRALNSRRATGSVDV